MADKGAIRSCEGPEGDVPAVVGVLDGSELGV